MRQRYLLRCAQRIAAALELPPSSRGPLTVCFDSIEQVAATLVSVRRRLDLARKHRWHMAAQRLARELQRELAGLAEHAYSARQQVVHAKQAPSLTAIFAEIRQLADEFDDVRYDPAPRQIVVTTDPITLEDVALGRFEIKLPISATVQPAGAVRVRALDPNPAASNPDVTHPHVSGGRLCGGEATPPLNAALATGRYADAALIVRSVLTHYNDTSPYVALQDWHGVPCFHCDRNVAEDDTETCSACSEHLCDECTIQCMCCDEVLCLGCAGRCETCEHRCCDACLGTCHACNETTCEGCLEGGLCSACHEESEDNDEEPENDDARLTERAHS